MAEFKLPDVGEGLTEAEIVSWKVKEGDTIEINDIIVEIETAKSLVELPSPYAGTVHGAAGRRGRDVAVGTPIISIGDPGRGAGPARPPRGGRPRRRRPTRWRSTCPTRPPAVAARARAWSAATRPTAARCVAPARARPRPATEAGARDPDAAAGRVRARRRAVRRGRRGRRAGRAGHVARREPPRSERVPAGRRAGDVRALAKPPVRKLAKDLGVDLASLRRHRPNGTVTASDVEAAAAAPASAVEAARQRAGSGDRERRARDPRADQGRAQDDGRRRWWARRSPPRTSPSGSPSTSPARWSSSTGSRPGASSATSRSRRCWCWPAR